MTRKAKAAGIRKLCPIGHIHGSPCGELADPEKRLKVLLSPGRWFEFELCAGHFAEVSPRATTASA